MGKRGKSSSSCVTRLSGAKKFCGQPNPLDETEPPTLRQIIQYSYYVKNNQPHIKHFDVSNLIAEELLVVRGKVNPRLPIYDKSYIIKKVTRELDKAATINKTQISAKQKKNMEEKLDFLFDIARCSCSLPIFPCKDKKMKCFDLNCQKQHIVCLCTEKNKCPIEEREYLRDQRSKIGPRESFQLSPTDKGAAKRQKLSATKVRQYDAYNKKQQLLKENVLATVSSEQISHFDSSQSFAVDESDSVFLIRSFPASSETYTDLKTPRFGMELVRGDVSSRLGASLGNALKLDLRAIGLFKSSVNPKQI